MAPADGFSMDVLAPRRPVDHKLSLRIYFRTADSILKQASVYRREANTLELYVLLLRYASLVSETIPHHRQYGRLNQLDKAHLKRKLAEAVQELETLKPGLQTQFRNRTSHFGLPARSQSFPFSTSTQEKRQQNSVNTNVYRSTLEHNYQQNFSFKLPTPKAETIARHSFLGSAPQNLRSPEPLKVHYPNLLDSAPIKADRLSSQSDDIVTDQVDQNAHIGTDQVDDIAPPTQTSEPPSQFDLVNQLAPPPIEVAVESLPATPPVAHESNLSSEVDAVTSKDPKQVHMSFKLMDEFMKMAKSNTLKNIETCGILAGFLEGGKFFVSALIIPKQEATANTCETIDEEEIFFAQDKLGLFQLGWIHTHPSQSCFMSSVDVHTHYSYQVMLQEAIAIVMAPQDPSRNFGIFRLTDPGGMNVIQQCPKRGFHGHEGTSDGSPLYDKCGHVYLDPKINFQVVDLR